MTSTRQTAAQAIVRFLSNQYVDVDGLVLPYFAGVWAIFGHGNVAGLGEALYDVRETLPTYRAHNEQAMAHAAIAFAKQKARRQAFVCTTSIGPGATNMVTAAALAHINRLPVLFLPGDVYANRRPDPVLQQIEDFGDATVSANACFRPVSAYFDQITRPEQILSALPRAMSTLTDPARCGPVTLCLCQDVQAEAYDYPDSFFDKRVWSIRRPAPDAAELANLVSRLKAATSPVLIIGGGVKYALAETALSDLALRHGLPFAETQAGKGAIPWDHPCNLGGLGVTGSQAANLAVQNADLIVGIGTRLQDFTTGSAGLFGVNAKLIQINIAAYDAHKFAAETVVGDAKVVMEGLSAALDGWVATSSKSLQAARSAWTASVDSALLPPVSGPPNETQVLGALWRQAGDDAVVVGAAGGLPGDMQKVWRTKTSGGYHMEYGYSCMGYEIAGGVGVKMASPEREVYVLVGDGSYLMMNAEIATAVMMGIKIIIILIDNGGYGCIHRLQTSTGSQPFNNRFTESYHRTLPAIDFVAHARSLGAYAEKATTITEFEAALVQAQARDLTSVLVIESDPDVSSSLGGAWWDVAIAEVSQTAAVREARGRYDKKINHIRRRQRK
ncbi:3D-(3,5/4)-trihydroxycyclohexane-1,2-dione hydrolase (plasmid) [Asticcacaulis sp. MM231]|uniref:3D-(3,5/4)-trihydroxycyclohexane-1,2-dione acylhydrolase (decyclizing) n=1 Tax=Asticcacaulis sp. MM231 TaxID=3157666 RepID=UPI0032D5845E